MKKAGIAVAGFLLAGTLFACTACGEGGANANTGKVEGDFSEEATAEQLSAAIAKIDTENAFGDMTADDWKLGVQISADLSMGVKATVSDGKQSATSETSTVIGGKFDFSVDKQMNLLAAGNLKLTATQKANGQSEKEESSFKAYLDSDFAYAEANANGETQKVKVSVSELMEAIKGMIPVSSDETEGDIVEEEEFDIAAILGGLAEVGGKIYLDESEGLKIKIGFDETFIRSAMEEIPEYAEMAEYLQFDSCVLDFYAVFDRDGKFGQISFNANVAAKMELTPLMKTEVSIKGGAVVKAGDVNVTLPAGIASDDSYQLIPIGSIIG